VIKLPSIPWLHSLQLSADEQTVFLKKSIPDETTQLAINLSSLQITEVPKQTAKPEQIPICRVFDSLEQFHSAYGLHTPFKYTVPGQAVTEAIVCPSGILFLSLDDHGQHLCLQTSETIRILKTIVYPMPPAEKHSNHAYLWRAGDRAPLLVWLSGSGVGDSCPLFRFWLRQMHTLGCHILWLPTAETEEQAMSVIQAAALQLKPSSLALFGTHQGATLAYSLMAKSQDYAAVIALDGIANLVGRIGMHPETPAQEAATLWELSALANAPAFHTPALLFSNPSNHVFGLGETQQIYQALVDQNVPAKMVLLHEAGSVLYSSELWQYFLNESTDWLRQYLFEAKEGLMNVR